MTIGSKLFSRARTALVLFLTSAYLQHAYALPPGTPTIIGPIPVNNTPGAGTARDYPFLASEPNYDLRRIGYMEEEFFIQGTATAYNTPGATDIASPNPRPGMTDGVAVSTGHPYVTRIMVRRPVDPKKFNGVVMVEWDNVSSGYGLPIHWQYSTDYLTRQGYVHVSVTTQRVGVHQPTTGLKDWSPTRYSRLDVTDRGTVTNDSLSYDIFSQVIVALRGQGWNQMMPGLKHPEVVLAVGQSQSAFRLSTYYNSIQPLHKLVDGFLVMVFGGPFRTDIPAKMMRVISETELMQFGLGATRQPDSSTLREWEIAGAAHVDYDWFQFRRSIVSRDKLTPPSLACDPEPPSHVPLRYVLNAGYHHLVNWIKHDQAPPSAEPILMTSVAPPVIPRDANGLSYGGIRQLEVEVPTATNRGDQVGMSPGCSAQYGMHIPFTDAQINRLYPNKDAYIRPVRRVLRQNVTSGFILHEDAQAILERAGNSPIGTGRPTIIK
jgi:hypothetical protein